MTSSDYSDSATVKNNVDQEKAALQRLKGLRKALHSLKNYAEYSITKIEKVFGSSFLHVGINSAPDDVLAMIFEDAVTSPISGQPGGDTLLSQTTLSIASVNRRFRSLALQQPTLWSILPYKQKASLFSLFLKRSGDVALTVFFGPSVPIWYVEAVKLLGHRWGEVIAGTVNGKLYLPENGEGIHVYPRLHTVQLEQSSKAPSTIDLSWTVSSLRRLSVQSVIPALPYDSFASLTSFSFATTVSLHNTSRILLCHLRSMRNLQDLSLSFGSMHAQFDDDLSSLCELLSLNRLHIRLGCDFHHKDSYQEFHAFLDRIVMPNVRKFEIVAIYDNKPLMQAYNKALFCPAGGPGDYTTSSSRLPSLEHMTIDIRPKETSTKKLRLPVDDLFQYPEMKHLYIRAPGVVFTYQRSMKKRNLCIRTMTIIGCNQGVFNFLQILLSHVNPDGTRFCHIIEKLTVIGCPEVTMNFLMEYLPEEKIEWSPVVDM